MDTILCKRAKIGKFYRLFLQKIPKLSGEIKDCVRLAVFFALLFNSIQKR